MSVFNKFEARPASLQKLCLFLLGIDSAISRNGGASAQEPGLREAICKKLICHVLHAGAEVQFYQGDPRYDFQGS